MNINTMTLKNLKLNAYYDDYDYNFNNSIEVLQYRSHHTTSICLFTGYGNLPLHTLEELTPLINDNMSNRRKIVKYIIDNDLNYYFDTIKDGMTNEIDYLMESINTYEYTREEFIQLYEEMGVTYDDEYIVVESIGHSQGDYSQVYINKKDYLKVFGVPLEGKTLESVKTFSDRLLWDSPIRGNLLIDFEYIKDMGSYTASQEVKLNINLEEVLDDTYTLDYNMDSIESIIKSSICITNIDSEFMDDLKHSLDIHTEVGI